MIFQWTPGVKVVSKQSRHTKNCISEVILLFLKNNPLFYKPRPFNGSLILVRKIRNTRRPPLSRGKEKLCHATSTRYSITKLKKAKDSENGKISWILTDQTVSGAHLGFSEGRGPNLKKEQTNIKKKRNEYKSCTGDNFLIIRTYKIRYTYDCR